MKIYLAGSRLRRSNYFMKKYKAFRLYSFLSEKSQVDKWLLPTKLMVDSGAHSWNKTTINKVATSQHITSLPTLENYMRNYTDFIEERKNTNIVFVELDTYGVYSIKLIDKMYNRIKKMGGNIQFIRVYHPCIDNGSLDLFKEWLMEGQTYIGVGGDSTYLYNKIFDLTRDKIKIHGFAMTKLNLLKKYPFYSVDSTSWQSGARYGKTCLENSSSVTVSRTSVLEKGKSIEHLITYVNNFYDHYNIKQFIAYQNFITDLWREKGVIWND